jgi:rhodanese-related sulfurtransferase
VRRPGTLRPLREAGRILAVTLAAGTGWQALGPASIPWSGQWATYMERQVRAAGLNVVTTADLRAAEWPPLLLDARGMGLYAAGRIPGAMPMPEKGRDAHLAALLPALEPDEPLVVYCAGRTCDEALVLGRQLRDAGYTGVSVYVGGYDAWRRAGHEIERDTRERKDL